MNTVEASTTEKEFHRNLGVLIPASLDKRIDIEAAHSEQTKRAVVIAALECYLSTMEATRG